MPKILTARIWVKWGLNTGSLVIEPELVLLTTIILSQYFDLLPKIPQVSPILVTLDLILYFYVFSYFYQYKCICPHTPLCILSSHLVSPFIIWNIVYTSAFTQMFMLSRSTILYVAPLVLKLTVLQSFLSRFAFFYFCLYSSHLSSLSQILPFTTYVK